MTSTDSLGPGFQFGGNFAYGMLFVGVVLLIGIGALTRQNERPYSATIFYLALGVAASAGLSLLGLRRLDPLSDHTLFEDVTQVALVIAVFGAGLAIERHVARSSMRLIGLLLVVVMPATIALIAVYGRLAMGLPLGAAILLGAVLAPTDPVLAGDLGLGRPDDEVKGEPRLSLHVEAGANDGLASPFVIIGLLVATHHGTGWVGHWVLVDLLYRAGVAVLFGALAGWLAARAITMSRQVGRFTPDLDGFLAPAVSLVIFGVAQAISTYGIVAVFVAGIAFRRHEFDHEVNARVHDGTEAAGRLLEMAVLLLVGSTFTAARLAVPGLSGWLLGPLVIVLIRPLLVLLVAARQPFDLKGRLFLGFFGVRGVAALYYAAVVPASGALSHAQTSKVVWTTAACVAVSVLVHGVSATPLIRRLGAGGP